MVKPLPAIDPVCCQLVDQLPEGMRYEPAWKGLRCVLRRNLDDVCWEPFSGTQIPAQLTDLAERVLDNTPPNVVFDGVLTNFEGDWNYVVWDLLAVDRTVLLNYPAHIRWERMGLAMQWAEQPVWPTPFTYDLAQAHKWLHTPSKMFSGVIAKPVQGRYANTGSAPANWVKSVLVLPTSQD